MKTRVYHYGHGVYLPINVDLNKVFNAARKLLRSVDSLDTESYHHLINVKRVCKDAFMHQLKRWQQLETEIEKLQAEKRERELSEFVWMI